MKFRRRGDLAMLETGTMAMATLLLGLLLVPDTWSEHSKADSIQALADAQRIAVGILRFAGDTGKAPTSASSGEEFSFLHGPGLLPAAEEWVQGKGEPLSTFLLQNGSGIPSWKGPYLRNLSQDPWGRAYLANVRSLTSGDRERLWVISAGPNGRVDTRPSDSTIGGDDVGVVAH